MAKRDLSASLKSRIETSKAASEEEFVGLACDELLGVPSSRPSVQRHKIPLNKVHPFRVANIGFKPYDEDSLKALAESINEDGLLDAIKVRKDDNGYEILAGHNRVNACLLLGWTDINADIYSVDDARAIIIATATNLKQRQQLLPSERAFAYRALLEAKKHQGKRIESEDDDRKVGHTTRDKVAAIFDVDRNLVQRFIRFTYLVPSLMDAVDLKRLNLTCAEKISFYSEHTQNAICERLEGNNWKLSGSVMTYIKRKCPPDTATPEDVLSAWDEAEAAVLEKTANSAKISFNRRRFAPYLDKLGSEEKLEDEFMAFLKAKLGNAEEP